MDQELTAILFEKILIQKMFSDEEVRDRIVPYLNAEVFQNVLSSKVVDNVIKFMKKNGTFPRMKELQIFIKDLEVCNHLTEIMNIDSSEYDNNFILGELEEYYRKALLTNLARDLFENINKDTNEFQSFPDQLREALSFTFDSSIGLSLLEDQEKIFEAFTSNDRYIPTGIKYLDKKIEGGCHEKTLNLFLAATNVGKSACLCGLSTNFLNMNKKVLYISLEMSEEKVLERILANLFDVEIGDLKKLRKSEFDLLYQGVKAKIGSDFKVIQRPAKSVSANVIRSILKEYKIKKGFEPDVVCVDYLGLMVPNSKSKDSNSYNEMKLVSEELRSVAQEYGFPIWSAVQTNRNGFKNVELELTDIADSIGTAATADLIIGITQNDELRMAGKFLWFILKNRYGLNDLKIYVGIDYGKMRLISLEDDRDESEIVRPKNIVDEASVEVLKTMNNNRKTNRLSGIE